MKRTRFLALLLTAVIILAIVPFSAVSAAGKVWDGSVASSFASGSGTENDPYIITTGAELALLSKGTEGMYFELGNDIVLNNTSYENWQNDARQWLDFGFRYSTLDGKGFSIVGLCILSENAYELNESVGLFGFSEEAIIKNLTVKNCYIEGAHYVGGIVGNGTKTVIQNCHFDGVIKGVETVYFDAKCFGGIMGHIYYSTINGCSSKGSVSGNESIGGIAGYIGYCGSVTNSVNYSSVSSISIESNSVGGIVGVTLNNTQEVSIIECINYGAVGTSDNKGDIGGIVGNSSGTVIENCKNYGDVKSKDAAGGISGRNYLNNNSYILNCDNYGDIYSYEEYAGGICGDSSGYIGECNNFGNVTAEYACGGIIGEAIDDNAEIEKCYNYGNLFGNNDCVGGIIGYASSRNAITLTNVYNGGDISGNGYLGGIIGYIYSHFGSNEIKIVGATNNGNLSGTEYVGGLIGEFQNYGEECHIYMEECWNKGEVKGIDYLGGLVGYFDLSAKNGCYSAITNCLNDGAVNILSESEYFNGCGGGLVGYSNNGLFINCINAGKMEFGENAKVGGIAGLFENITISDCVYYKNNDYLGTPEGELENSHSYTADQMKNQDNFINYDFLNVWVMGEEHPELKEATLSLLGDVNFDGVINSKDYVTLKRYCFGTVILGEEAIISADVNCDRIIDKKDYALIKRYCFNSGIIK